MASNYHLGYKTNVVRTVSGQEVSLSGTGGDSNNIEIDDLYQGVINCSTNPNYPAGTKNMFWRVSVAGKIGGAAGIDVEVNDKIVCIVDNAGGTEALVGSSFIIMQGNIDPATVTELRAGISDVVYVTPKVLADALNGGNAFTSSASTLILTGGSENFLHVTNVATTVNLIKVSGATNLDCFIDFNDLVAEDAHIISTSGTAATTWSARIKVITPDGNPGWINVYSASNENPV